MTPSPYPPKIRLLGIKSSGIRVQVIRPSVVKKKINLSKGRKKKLKLYKGALTHYNVTVCDAYNDSFPGHCVVMLTPKIPRQVWAEMSYWLHMSCHKKIQFVNVLTKHFHLIFISVHFSNTYNGLLVSQNLFSGHLTFTAIRKTCLFTPVNLIRPKEL
jgi:hypothetical protein